MGTNGTLLQHYNCPIDLVKKEKWIGLSHYSTFIIALLDTGKGYLIDTTLEQAPLDTKPNTTTTTKATTKKEEQCVTLFDVGQDNLFCMRLHETSALCATGGKERELHVWDTNTLGSPLQTLIYKAKNVPNSHIYKYL